MANEILIICIVFLAQSFLLSFYFETIYDKGRRSKDNDKYKKQIQDLQNMKKGMKKMQSRYDKLQHENKCLKKQLCKKV